MYFDLKSPWNREYREATREGLRRHNALKLDAVVCWGWRRGQMFQRRHKPVIVLERGYIGDRFYWTSIGLDGLNGRATFPEYPDDGGARFDRMGSLAPWNPRGDYILLIGQVRGDAALAGRDMTPWYAETAKRAAEVYGLPVRFRPHPESERRGGWKPVPGCDTDTGPLADSLESASVVVTWNSNTAVDAMLAGKPAVAFDPGSMAWPVAGHALGEAATPDRERWAHALAWKQWSMDEIRSGEALEGVVRILREAPDGN